MCAMMLVISDSHNDTRNDTRNGAHNGAHNDARRQVVTHAPRLSGMRVRHYMHSCVHDVIVNACVHGSLCGVPLRAIITEVVGFPCAYISSTDRLLWIIIHNYRVLQAWLETVIDCGLGHA